jgi:hypothetical protein
VTCQRLRMACRRVSATRSAASRVHTRAWATRSGSTAHAADIATRRTVGVRTLCATPSITCARVCVSSRCACVRANVFVRAGLCECYKGYYSSDGYGGSGIWGDCGAALDPIASCPGTPLECSGHGVCNDFPQYRCECMVGWMGGDCSERECLEVCVRACVCVYVCVFSPLPCAMLHCTSLQCCALFVTVASQAFARLDPRGLTRPTISTTLRTLRRSARTRASATATRASARARRASAATRASAVRSVCCLLRYAAATICTAAACCLRFVVVAVTAACVARCSAVSPGRRRRRVLVARPVHVHGAARRSREPERRRDGLHVRRDGPSQPHVGRQQRLRLPLR